MRIVHFSDIHVGSEKFFRKDNLLYIIEEINGGEFDLAIFTGDVTHEGQREEYELGSELLNKIECPLICIPGNHDARSGGISLFEEYIAPQNGVHEIGDAVVVYVNSAIADSNAGRVGRVKFNMLREALNTHSDKAIKILAVHHHVLPVPMSGRERNVLANAGDLLDLILRADVDLVLSGHRHYPNVYDVEHTVFVNAGTASSGKTRYGDVNSYNIIDIDQHSKQITTKRLNGNNTVQSFPRKVRQIYSDFGERKMRVAHLSNTYFSDTRAFLDRHYRHAVDSLHDLNPDLLVHCGGLVEEGIPRDYDIALQHLKDVHIPMVITPAGRDLNYLGYDLFNKHFGSLDQSYSNDEFLFQGVSTPQYDSSIGVVGSTERRALLDHLEISPQAFKAVFLHHNIIPIPHSREKGLLEDAGDLLRELVDSDVSLVLTGTSSHPYATNVGGTVIVNANALSSAYQRSRFGNSFNLIDIYEGAIAVSEVNALWGKRRLLGIWERNS